MDEHHPIDPGAEMALRLRHTCEAHDSEIGGHLDRVARHACEIGRLVGYSDRRLVELHYAAPLHDLGKIAIPLHVLNKPGLLTTPEQQLVKTHTVIGHRILDGSLWPIIQCAATIALSHHECWDGSGYPQGLRGEAIPLDARIMAVADVYDALISPRAYKLSWDEDRVVAEIRRLRGTKFDPEIVDVFINSLPVRASAP